MDTILQLMIRLSDLGPENRETLVEPTFIPLETIHFILGPEIPGNLGRILLSFLLKTLHSILIFTFSAHNPSRLMLMTK